MLATVLGAAMGFVPGFAQAPGLLIILILALIIFNANLPLAAVTGAVAELVSLVLLPVSFALGRFLLDGPTQPLFAAIINVPILALCGFEYYVTTGGLVLGVLFGIVVGGALVKTIQGFRVTVGRLEEGSEAYQRWMGRWWVKLLVLLVLGRGPKQSYTELQGRAGGFIRPVGVVFAVLILVLIVVAQMFFAGPIIMSALRSGLERANGATVDLDSAELDLAKGRMIVKGLAMADPNALEKDLFRADQIEADLSGASLLRKQLKLDRVLVSDAEHGVRRSTPGRLLGRRRAPSPPVEPRAGEASLDVYIQDAGKWVDRLAQVQRWIAKLSGPPVETDEPAAETGAESLRERLAREARALGYARVAAHHLIQGAPRFTVGELVAEKVKTDALDGETVDIRANNISTEPHLLSEAPAVDIRSSGQTLELALALGAMSGGGGESSVRFVYRGLPVDRIADSLSVAGQRPVSGGTMDVALDGAVWACGGACIDMPMRVTLRDTTIAISGAGSAPVDELTIALGLRGPIDNPRIRLDDSQLADALVAAGAGVLAKEVRGRAGDLIEDAASDIDLTDKLRGIELGKGLSGSGNKDDKGATTKKDDKNGKDDLQKAADDLTKSLFGGKKKDAKKDKKKP
jgi:uncharacterized protein (TIGR03546 family)